MHFVNDALEQRKKKCIEYIGITVRLIIQQKHVNGNMTIWCCALKAKEITRDAWKMIKVCQKKPQMNQIWLIRQHIYNASQQHNK